MFSGLIEVSRIQGNNFDIVTLADHNGTIQETVREYHDEEYVDVDSRDGQSPARWGT